MPLFFEDTEQVSKKTIPIPKNAKAIFKAMEKVYEPYLNTNTKGAKILKSLASDKHYNKKGDNASKNGQDSKENSISFEDAKKRLQRQDKLAPNSIEYQLYGGELAHNIMKRGVERARNVQAVKQVMPPKPTTAQQAMSLPKMKQEKIKTPQGTVTYKTFESRQIQESSDDYDTFYEYLEDYGVDYVLNQYLDDPNGKQDWFPLIDPNMYEKALQEFTKFGRFINFPTKYVYQWMGIIMKNTAILCANTELAGHASLPSLDQFEYFIDSVLNGKEWDWGHENNVIRETSFDELGKILKEWGYQIQENHGIHKDGQYDLFMNQAETDAYDAKMADIEARKQLESQMAQELRRFQPAIDAYNKRFEGDSRIFVDHGKLFIDENIMQFLDEIGFYRWMVMPDGSDAFSDYALQPLAEIIAEYHQDLPPERVIVLINRALDVVHARGDVASIFIIGGRKTLSSISESINRPKRAIYITEEQLKRLRLWQIL